ncbi:MAG TPA: lytic transglycosylase domain-containing protein [Candidatus Acidoferrum sp.]|nr:lytic transglycosylase domain-containing protein [Candidatus Acidoferrum sp.]
MTRAHSVLVTVAVLVLLAVPAGAETFRFVETDGTVHFTNTPTDPQYQRMGFTSGTERGWLQLPLPDLAPYAREIREAAERYGVEEALIKAVIRVESGFNSRAVSPKGARGLMQLMPGTASMLGVRNSFDPRENIDGGVRHLRGLIDRFGSDLKLALAAYNAGEQAVANHGGIPPFRETRDYVTRILGLFAPAPAVAASPAPEPPQYTYRVESPDGTVTYTNIPPKGKL